VPIPPPAPARIEPDHGMLSADTDGVRFERGVPSGER